MIARLLSVEPLKDYSIFVKFSDGTEGTVNLQHLAHKGVFADWDKDNLFQKAHITDYGAIEWNEDIDICADNVYLQLQGLTFDKWKQKHKEYATN
jgi:hypothetical protein